MGRKQRFYRIKNYERKKNGRLPLTVSIPLTSISLLSTPASLDPVQAPSDIDLSMAPLPNLETLQTRVQQCSLPSTWVDMTDQTKPTSSLVLASITLQSSSSSVATRMVVRVDQTLTWSLSCHGRPVDLHDCTAHSNLPHRICSLNDLTVLLSSLNEVHICSGNPVHEFQELVDLHHGVFQDQAGIIVLLLTTTYPLT